MSGFLSQYGSEIVSALGGFLSGSFLTFKLTRNQVSGSGSVVDQSRAQAGADIVGGNKTTDVRR